MGWEMAMIMTDQRPVTNQKKMITTFIPIECVNILE